MASGDAEAFARFYDLYFETMFIEARRLTGRDEAFCLDVVQDAMMRIIRARKIIGSAPGLAAWLRSVVRSAAYDRLRRDERRRRRELRTGPARSSEAVTAGDATRDEELTWLRGEIAKLDTGSAELLAMRHRLGWTLERIGAAVGLAPGAVDGRLRRIIRRLRAAAREISDE